MEVGAILQETVERGKAVGVKMELLQHASGRLLAGRAWAAEAARAIEGIPTLAQVRARGRHSMHDCIVHIIVACCRPGCLMH